MTKSDLDSAQKPMTKKTFQEMPEVETFYKLIYKYDLREEVYKKAIENYIRVKSARLRPQPVKKDASQSSASQKS